MRSIFTNRELEYIKQNYNKMTYIEMAEELNKFNEIKKNEIQIRNKARTLGLSKRKHIYDRRYFENIDTEEKAYWLGFIYADGYIAHGKRGGSNCGGEVSIQLQYSDRDHLKKFASALGGNVKITSLTKKEGMLDGYVLKERKLAQIRLYSNDMLNDLVSHGIVQNKTNSTIHPKLSNPLIDYFIRGFFDGDGCLYFRDSRHKNAFFTNSNKQILEYIQNHLLDVHGIYGKVYKEKDKKYRLMYTNNESFYGILNVIYNNANIYLDRKYNHYKSILKNKVAV